ncbi:protein of unknown function [Tenacibaculum aestuariivivum]
MSYCIYFRPKINVSIWLKHDFYQFLKKIELKVIFMLFRVYAFGWNSSN